MFSRDEEILLQAGESEAIAGAVAMRPPVPYASCKPESDEPRRVLHIDYAASRDIGDRLRLALV